MNSETLLAMISCFAIIAAASMAALAYRMNEKLTTYGRMWADICDDQNDLLKRLNKEWTELYSKLLEIKLDDFYNGGTKMKVRYNVTPERLNEMAKVVSDALDGWSIDYMGAPTFSYQVGDFEITKDGALIFSGRTDTEMVEAVLEALEQAGFKFKVGKDDDH
jgi:hypothetical protein